MPILGTLVLTLFTGLVDFLVVYFTRTVAIKLAFGALIVTAFGVLSVSINVAVSALAYSMPSTLVTAFAFLFPANVVNCVAAVIACDSVVAGFRLFVSGITV